MIFFLIGFIGKDTMLVAVLPVDNTGYFNKPVSKYEGGQVILTGQLVIVNPTITERMLLPNAGNNLDQISLLFLSICSIIIILIVPKLQQLNLFREDISASIRWLGYLLMLHGFLSLYLKSVYIPGEITRITHHEFTNSNPSPFIIWIEWYFAYIVIAAADIFRRAMKLQEEQDLTI